MKRLRNRPLLRNIFSSGATAVLNAGLTALSVRIFLGALGMERYGLWATLTVIVSVIQLSNAGIGPALTTRAAELQRDSELDALEKTVSAAQFVVLGAGTVSVFLGAIAAIPITRFLGITDRYLAEGADAVPWVCLLATLSLSAQLASSTLLGVGRADVVAIQGFVAKILQVSLSTGLLHLGFGIKAIVWGYTLAALVQVIAGELALRRACGIVWRPWVMPEFRQLKPVYRLGASLALSSSFQLGLAPFGKWLVAQSLGLSMVSVYEIGWSVSMHIRTLAATAFRPTVREFARHKGYPDRTRRLLFKSYRTIALTFTPAFAGFALALPWFLELWLGSSYSEALDTPTRIFLLSAWIGMFGIPGYYCLLGESRALALVISQSLQATLNVALCTSLWALLPYSPSLAALAMCVAVAGTTVFCILSTGRLGTTGP